MLLRKNHEASPGNVVDCTSQIASIRNCDDFSRDFAPPYSDPPHAHRQLEPSRPRAPRIKVQHPVAPLLFRHMAVAIDHYLEPSGFRFQIEPRQIVQHIDGDFPDLDDFRCWQLARPCSLINVSANRRDRAKSCEFLENLRIAYVSGMNNALGPTQRFQRFRTQQAVRVGDDANQDGSSQFSKLSYKSALKELGFSRVIPLRQDSSTHSSRREMALHPGSYKSLAFSIPPPVVAAGPSSPALGPIPG